MQTAAFPTFCEAANTENSSISACSRLARRSVSQSVCLPVWSQSGGQSVSRSVAAQTYCYLQYLRPNNRIRKNTENKKREFNKAWTSRGHLRVALDCLHCSLLGIALRGVRFAYPTPPPLPAPPPLDGNHQRPPVKKCQLVSVIPRPGNP